MSYLVFAVATAAGLLALFMALRFLSYAIRGVSMSGWAMFALIFWTVVGSTLAIWLFPIVLPMVLS